MSGYRCPVDKSHGALLDLRNAAGAWFCPHEGHGGNGRTFTLAQIEGNAQVIITETEAKMAEVLSTRARQALIREALAEVIPGNQGSMTSATKALARQLNTDPEQVQKEIEDMATAVKAKAAAKAAPKAKAAPAEKAERAPRVKLEHVEPATFAALRDKLGLSNKEVSQALAAAGQGNTLSRVTELTHSKGATVKTFATFKAAVEEFAASKATPAPAAKPARKAAAAKA